MAESLHQADAAMIRIEIPWPDRILHPNARPHWAQKAKAAKSSRQFAFAVTRMAIGPLRAPWKRVSVSYKFHPPDNRRRDLDGMISSMKSAQDGISDAIKIDDSLFNVTYSIAEPIKGGLVVVTIEEGKE